MKDKEQRIAIAVLAVAVLGSTISRWFPFGEHEIVYRGKTFVLGKRYSSYDDFKEDPDNFTTQQKQAIHKIILSECPPTSFANEKLLRAYAREMKVPGYGLGHTWDESVGVRLRSFSIEMPGADQYRVFVYCGSKEAGGPLKLFDDFTVSIDRFWSFDIDDSRVRCVDDSTGAVLRERCLESVLPAERPHLEDSQDEGSGE